MIIEPAKRATASINVSSYDSAAARSAGLIHFPEAILGLTLCFRPLRGLSEPESLKCTKAQCECENNC